MRVQCETQNSPEWFAARLGKVTASRMVDAMAKLKRAGKNGVKGEYSMAHHNYASEKSWELITRATAKHYVSPAMDIGAQFEGEARGAYWTRFGTMVEMTGFVLHPTLDYLGASPDGLLGDDGGLELKVPLFTTHCGYLEADEIPEEYVPQMQCNMLCCERKWWDFCSYCPPDVAPDLPEEYRIFRKRLFADPAVFAEMEEAGTAVMERAVALVETLRKRYPPIQAAPKPPSRYTFDPSKSLAEQDLSFLDSNLMDVP